MIWTDVFCCLNERPNVDQDDTSTIAVSTASKQAGMQALIGKEVRVADACVFCNPTPEDFHIVTENERFVVFTDRDPAARFHLLAIPRTHVANTRSLRGEEGATMVQDLLTIGEKALQIIDRESEGGDSSSGNGRIAAKDVRETRFGFHIPPFRSVDHLHLHCLALPFNSSLKALKYRIAPGSPPASYKGWGWFVTADQAMAILRAGRTIDVEAC